MTKQIIGEYELNQVDIGKAIARGVADDVGIGRRNFDSFNVTISVNGQGQVEGAKVTLYRDGQEKIERPETPRRQIDASATHPFPDSECPYNTSPEGVREGEPFTDDPRTREDVLKRHSE
jgi:hypothetical protein